LAINASEVCDFSDLWIRYDTIPYDRRLKKPSMGLMVRTWQPDRSFWIDCMSMSWNDVTLLAEGIRCVRFRAHVSASSRKWLVIDLHSNATTSWFLKILELLAKQPNVKIQRLNTEWFWWRRSICFRGICDVNYCISMIILSMPLDHRSCLVFASLIFLPLSTPSTITS